MNLQQSQYIRVGLFFIFGIVFTWIIYEALSNTSISKTKGYEVHAVFHDLLQLKASDEVRLAGVRIGNVQSTRLIDHQAVAILRIEEGVTIPKDSIATISIAGLLGNNYIAIEPGVSNDYLIASDYISTKNPMDINALMNKIGNTIDQFSNLAGGETFTNLNELITTNKLKLNNLFTDLEQIAHKVNSGQGTLGLLVNDQKAYNDFVHAATNVAEFSIEAKKLIQMVETGEGVLGVLIHDKQLAINVRETVENLAEFSNKINNDNSTLGRLIASDELYAQAQSVLNKVDNAANSLGDNGPISAAGVAAAALF